MMNYCYTIINIFVFVTGMYWQFIYHIIMNSILNVSVNVIIST